MPQSLSGVRMPEYTHTLIPDRIIFAADPKQVGAFLTSLVTLGAAPLKPTVTASKLSGEVRTFKNPFTGKTDSFPMRRAETLKDVAAVPATLKGLNDYNVTLAGKDRPSFPPSSLTSQANTISLFIAASARKSSRLRTGTTSLRSSEKWNSSAGHAARKTGWASIIIRTPSKSSRCRRQVVRFWIEFEYGKMLFPPIVDRLDLIEPKIVAAAEKEFAVKLFQAATGGVEAQQRMKLTGAAILVSRGMKVLEEAPAAYPYRYAALGDEFGTAARSRTAGAAVQSWVEQKLLADLGQYGVQRDDLRIDWSQVVQEGYCTDFRGRMLESLGGSRSRRRR